MSNPTVVTKEVAVVYRGHRRRFFTERAAAKSIASAAIRAACACDYKATPAVFCVFHDYSSDPDALLHAIRAATGRVLRGEPALPEKP